ncbi:MAG: hypothetical protein WCT99_02480 [Bacteroidota bacterium]
MKKIYLLCVLSLPAAFLIGQDSSDSRGDRSARNGDDIEQFVNDIVDRVSSGIDRIAEERSDEYDDDAGQDRRSVVPDEAVTFNGDTEIAENDTIHGDLVVKYGTLTVRGVVTGDVLVVNGLIAVKSTGHIKGNVRSMNGSVSKEEGAVVEGYIEQSTETKNYKRKRTSRVKYSYSFKPSYWLDVPYVDNNFLFRYNRTEGFFIGLGSEKKFYWDGSKSVSGFGSFGYGFAMHRWRMQLGLDRQFAAGGDVLYEFGGEAHSITDTKDEWLMPLGENNLAAIFFSEDFRDYYQREGFSLHTARYSREGELSTMVDLRYGNDRYNSMLNNTDWAVFGGNTGFRNNPPVNEGMIRSITLAAGLSTVEKYRSRTEGWDAYGKVEYAGKEIGGDYDFNHALIELRRYQQISDDDQISIRLRAGSLEGTNITQRTFELGGANTMPAYGFKEFSGNRMVLGNLEYQLNGHLIDELFLWPHGLDLLLFGDAGAVTTAVSKKALYDGFDALTTSQIKSDIGFGFGWNEEGARLGFAWRTDKQASVAVFLRLHRAF